MLTLPAFRLVCSLMIKHRCCLIRRFYLLSGIYLYFSTMEERAQAMREAGIYDPEEPEHEEAVLEMAGHK